MIILITGGAGFIGSNLSDRLLRLGHNVICLDNFDNFYERNIKERNIKEASMNELFSVIEADITDSSAIDSTFNTYKFDLVIHLAAKAGVRPSIMDPVSYYNVNVQGTLNILESMRKHDIKKLIFASSSSVYGNNIKVPFSESDIVDKPISPYAASKKASELLCHSYHHLYNFDIFCLRFFTVFGPRQRPDLAIHKFTNCILSDQTLNLYGDGSSNRDYTYIDDIINGIVSSIEKLKGYEIINLGESKTISLSHVIKILEQQLNKKALLRELPMQPGDVRTTYADISKAIRILGYQPKTEFEIGIRKFLKWKIEQ